MPKVTDQDAGKEFFLYPSPELTADLEKWRQEQCAHPTKEIRRSRQKNGTTHYRSQCLRCGNFDGHWIGQASLSKGVADANMVLKEQHERLREDDRRGIYQKHVRLQRAGGNQFKKEHREYLASRAWKEKRDKVLRRANFLCEGCLEAPATQVHHLHYKRWKAELLFDLVALCRTCHERCHGDDTAAGLVDEHDTELPCFGCRWQAWGHSDQMHCAQFDVIASNALHPHGPCGLVCRAI